MISPYTHFLMTNANDTNNPVVVCLDPAYQAQALALSRQLNFPLYHTPQTHTCQCLVSSAGLALCLPNQPLSHALIVDFVGGKAGFRRRAGGKELLIQAVGLKPHRPLRILDATAGLGRDSFVLAAHGAQVTACERHPLLAALLADALTRARADAQTAPIAAAISLHVGEAKNQFSTGFDVIYLDPMFPERQKSAAVKKDLQVLQMLLTDAPVQDEADLLAQALIYAKRVVVKRPRHAPRLGNLPCSGSIEGNSTRFDLYAGQWR